MEKNKVKKTTEAHFGKEEVAREIERGKELTVKK